MQQAHCHRPITIGPLSQALCHRPIVLVSLPQAHCNWLIAIDPLPQAHCHKLIAIGQCRITLRLNVIPFRFLVFFLALKLISAPNDVFSIGKIFISTCRIIFNRILLKYCLNKNYYVVCDGRSARPWNTLKIISNFFKIN